jgi:hypothetical protein
MTLIQVNRDLDHFARGVGPHHPNVGSRFTGAFWNDFGQIEHRAALKG